MFRKKVIEKVDDAAAALIYAGQKVGGEKGERVANRAAHLLTGAHYCPPDKKCRICKD